MELPGRLVVAALITLGVAAAAAAALASRGRPATAIVAHAYPIPTAERRIQVEVLNATARPSLARLATRMLRREGIDVVFFGNADDNARPDSTRVIARRGDRSSAERVARALGQGVVSVRADTLRRVDVTVVLGADYRPPADSHP
ncbi:MAG TPA: LytR C-terminal domain-containing protein [Gemmatimonadales bacterium]|nr:LytR C-terminal domain-containing protein [Gemmatimonadales bacterium]